MKNLGFLYLKKLKITGFKKLHYSIKNCENMFGSNSCENYQEFIAECFNNYYYLCNLDNFSTLAEEGAFKVSEFVVKEIKACLDKYKK